MSKCDVDQDLQGLGPQLPPDQRAMLDDHGYAVLTDVLSEAECDLLSREADEIWERERLAGQKFVTEPGVRFTSNILSRSVVFQKCMSDPRVLAGVRAVLGPAIRLSLMHSRRADTGCGNQPLHDLSRRRGRPFLKCNTTWCLDEFTLVNGATRVLPGSHLAEDVFLARCEDPALPHPDECRVTASRGAVVIMNSHLIHGGSTNVSDAPRRCIHSAFGLASEPTVCDWTQLPSEIRAGLDPDNLELLGLGPG